MRSTGPGVATASTGWSDLLGRAGLRGLERESWALFAIRTVDSFGFSASLPFFGVYLLEVRGVSLASIGLVYFITGIIGLGSQLVGGRLTDALGPRKVMLVGFGASLVAGLLLGTLVLRNEAVWVFFVVYPIFSFLRSLSGPAIASIIAGHPFDKVRPGLNLLTIGGNLGFAIGPAIGGPLASEFGYYSVFFLSASTVVPVIILVAILLKGGLRQSGMAQGGPRVRRMLSWKEDGSVIAFLFLTFCLTISIGYEITPLSLYVAALHFSAAQIGYLFATNGLIIVLFQLPIVSLTERAKRVVLPLFVAGPFAAASFVIAAISTQFVQFELMMVILTIGEILITVPSQTIISLLSRAGNRGTYQGYYYAAGSAARSVASFVGPLSFEAFGSAPALGWYLIAGFTLLASLGFFLLGPRLQRDYDLAVGVRSGQGVIPARGEGQP